MRLAKYLSGAGVASRRKAEQIIREGKVSVNGTVTILPQTLVAGSDDIRVGGSPVKKPSRYYYLLLDKPPGYLSTVTDTHDRPTVLDLVQDIPERVYPVGRLDADTTGLLLLTNDGELAFRLAHPRYEVEKTYRAWVKGTPTAAALAKLAGGVIIEGEKTHPAKVKLVKKSGVQRTMLEITLTEGKKRQVKLMCTAVGHSVLKLRRIRYAFLTALGLHSGEYRHLKRDEVSRLYRLVGLKEQSSRPRRKG